VSGRVELRLEQTALPVHVARDLPIDPEGEDDRAANVGADMAAPAPSIEPADADAPAASDTTADEAATPAAAAETDAAQPDPQEYRA